MDLKKLFHQKSDSREIESFLKALKSESWLKKSSRKWWPKFVFHYTDIRNAVEILKSGKLSCRQILEDNKNMPVDNASPHVIQATEKDVKQYVRLYFRPRTPTQFRNEGIRPKDQLKLDAHCPVPVFFLFDSVKILTHAESCFSDGNMASSQCKTGDNKDFLESLPFRKIYHLGPYDTHLNSDIKFHRNAEVVIPQQLDLSALNYILCRSPAERDSFLHLLPTQIWEKWYKRIFVESKHPLFERQWTFVERVDLSETEISFYFSIDTKTPGPFELYFELIDKVNGKKYSYKKDGFYTNSYQNSKWSLKVPNGVLSYRVKLELDGNLVYANDFFGEEVPF